MEQYNPFNKKKWSNATVLKIVQVYNPCSAFGKYWKGAHVVDRGNKDGDLNFSPDPLFGS
jgi:hypothetical protein